MSGTPCIVLAGGLGTRLRSAVPDLPKCLAPVGARSFLEVQLAALAAQGFDRFVLSLGHMADVVRQAVGHFRVDAAIDCIVEPQPLGTGGAILHAMAESGLDEAAVVNGDTFIEAPLGAMLPALATAAGERARMAVVPVPDRARYGGVELHAGCVTAFVEKGRSGAGLINAGLYRVHLRAFEGFERGAAFSMESQVMSRLMAARALSAVQLDGQFIDIGVPEDYWRFCAQRGAAVDGR